MIFLPKSDILKIDKTQYVVLPGIEKHHIYSLSSYKICLKLNFSILIKIHFHEKSKNGMVIALKSL
jgi:hypothetical protein